MAFDLTQMIQAAAEAMSDGGDRAAQPVKEGAKKAKGGLSMPTAFLVGAGAVAAGRLLVGSRGRDFMENLQERLVEYEQTHFNSGDDEGEEEPEDDYEEDEEPEAEEDEDFDEEEPEAEEDEDFDEEEPEAEEDEDFDEEYDEDEEPEAEEDEDFDDEEETDEAPPKRRRARSGSSSGGR